MPFFARLREVPSCIMRPIFLGAAKQGLISPNGIKPMTDIDRKLTEIDPDQSRHGRSCSAGSGHGLEARGRH